MFQREIEHLPLQASKKGKNEPGHPNSPENGPADP
jgi:hypothetical protein